MACSYGASLHACRREALLRAVTTPAPPRSPLFWILIALGCGAAACCLLSVGVMALGAMVSDDDELIASAPPSTGAPGGGGEYLVAVEISRGGSMTQPLPGGRWIAQYGSTVDNVVARSGTTAWVQTNASGSLYELVFDDDGRYALNWVSSITLYGQRSQSRCTEKGTWSLSGTQLTLTPESQVATYSNSNSSQEKEDEDLRERTYEVRDLTLETLETAGEVKRQLPGLSMIGPEPAWDTGSGDRHAFTLQRLTD